MSKHILLVDEDELVLKSLTRSLRKLPGEWQVHYAEGVFTASDILADVPIDILISEIRLAGDNGRMLLETAREVRPQAARIILTGQVDPNAIFQFYGLAHQLLAKPWDNKVLIETIQRSYLVRGLLANPHMQAILNQIDNLPTIPEVYLELERQLKAEDISLADISSSVIRDPSLTVKIMQIVNSPYYGLPLKVVDPEKAVGLLGIDFLKGILLASGLFQTDAQAGKHTALIDRLWEHSIHTSSIIKQIAKMESLEGDIADTSAIAGLLHDVGKIILGVHFPDEAAAVYQLVQERKLPRWKAELKVLGTTHAEVGAYLLGLWGMPIDLLQAILCHHQPILQNHNGINPQVLLHAANAIVNAQDAGDCRGRLQDLDYDFFRRSNLTDRLSRWQSEICSMI